MVYLMDLVQSTHYLNRHLRPHEAGSWWIRAEMEEKWAGDEIRAELIPEKLSVATWMAQRPESSRQH